MFGIYGWNRRKDPADYDGLYCCPTWKEVVPLLMNSDLIYFSFFQTNRII